MNAHSGPILQWSYFYNAPNKKPAAVAAGSDLQN
jgi:hypothetical protein